jgi:hypothetical protein
LSILPESNAAASCPHAPAVKTSTVAKIRFMCPVAAADNNEEMGPRVYAGPNGLCAERRDCRWSGHTA